VEGVADGTEKEGCIGVDAEEMGGGLSRVKWNPGGRGSVKQKKEGGGREKRKGEEKKDKNERWRR